MILFLVALTRIKKHRTSMAASPSIPQAPRPDPVVLALDHWLPVHTDSDCHANGGTRAGVDGDRHARPIVLIIY